MKNELKMIKKLYGEDMAHYCRETFATILETKGLLLKLLLDNFEPNHSLYQDIIEQKLECEFKNYIYILVDTENNNEIKSDKSPQELLNEAGYDFYECHTEEEIQRFKKYYAPGEQLCTFNGGRLNNDYVFFALKKDVDEIKREDYPNPKRQDRYGTSVISIQFTKDNSHTLSIKNRYNHIVNNCDATFSNNLDNIIPGLTESFANKYGLVQQYKNNGFEIDGYVRANDGKYYKYNYEIFNVYYCPNNIIIDNFEVKRYPKEKYIIFDYFILDLVNKKIMLYDKTLVESFIEMLENIEKIEIEKETIGKIINITLKDDNKVKIVLDKNNAFIKLEILNVEEVGDNFLFNNNTIQEINLPSLRKAGNCFFHSNNTLKKLSLPNLEEAGNYFLGYNNTIQEIYLPNLKKAGNYFFYKNNALKIFSLPCLEEVGDNCFYYNNSIQEIYLPNLKIAKNYFFYKNNTLQKLSLPSLEEAERFFFFYNDSIQEIDMPNLKIAGYCFLYYNNALKKLSLPNLEEAENYFLPNNTTIEEIYLPNLEIAKDYFLYGNNAIRRINMSNLKIVGCYCLFSHQTIDIDNFKNRIGR